MIRTPLSRAAMGMTISALLCAWTIIPVGHSAIAEAAPLIVGSGAAWVSGTGSVGVTVRSGPATSHDALGVLPEGTRVQVTDGPVTDAGGRQWYKVSSDHPALHGWCVADYLTTSQPATAEQTNVSGGRTMTAMLTAYSYQSPGSYTKLGTPVRWGVVAVDPSVIPLGSHIKIDGYDMVFSAEDTGGSVSGNHIDVFFDSYADAMQFGVQYRTVTIL